MLPESLPLAVDKLVERMERLKSFCDHRIAAQSISNTASPAVFTISANSTTVGGGFIAGVNTGTAGIIYAVAAFTAGDKVLDDGDTLSVTATFTMAAA